MKMFRLMSVAALNLWICQSMQVKREALWPRMALDRTVIIPQASFTYDQVKARFLKILSDNKDCRIVRVEVFTQEADATRGYKGWTDMSFENWSHIAQAYKDTLPESAQLISMEGNAGMRMHYASGDITEETLLGQSPYVRWAHNARLHLADISVSEMPGVTEDGELVVDLFYWTEDSFDVEMTRALLTEQVAYMNVKRINVNMEHAPRFIYSDHFPVVFPYFAWKKLPSESEYNSELKASCSSVFGPVTCMSFGSKGR